MGCSRTQKIEMKDIVFVLILLTAIASFVMLMRMILFQKTWKVLPDGTLPEILKPGTYDIAVMGSISGGTAKRTEIYIDNAVGIAPNVTLHWMPSAGLSNLTVFTRFARFQLEAKAELNVSVANLGVNDIKRSQLLMKRLLFGSKVKAVVILITPAFSYIRLFLLAAVSAGLFSVLFLL